MKNTKKLALIYAGGYTQATLAAALYTTPCTLSRYLTGTRTWPPTVLARAAELLHINPAELLE